MSWAQLLEIPRLLRRHAFTDEPDRCHRSIPMPRVVFLEVTGFILSPSLTKQCGSLGLCPELVGVLWRYLPSLCEDSLYLLKKKKDRSSPPMPQDSRCHFVPAQGFRVTTCCAGLGVFQNLFAVWLMRTAFEKRLRARGPQARCSGGSRSPAGWPGAGWPAPRLAAVGLVIWDAGSPAPACRFHPLA